MLAEENKNSGTSALEGKIIYLSGLQAVSSLYFSETVLCDQ